MKNQELECLLIQRNLLSDNLFAINPSASRSNEKNDSDYNDRSSRFYRLSNRNELKDPITGYIKTYQISNLISPLGTKNNKLPEKVSSTSIDPSEYSFHRQTKINPKVFAINPITGQSSAHKPAKSLIPVIFSDFKIANEVLKPARYVKGSGYKKSEIFY